MAKKASAETLAIRKLLDERNGEITYNDALPILAKRGINLGTDEAKARKKFDVQKYHWKNSKKKGKGKKTTAKKPVAAAPAKKTKRVAAVAGARPPKFAPGAAPAATATVARPARAATGVSADEALQFVEANGGPSHVRTLLEAAEALIARAAKLAG